MNKTRKGESPGAAGYVINVILMTAIATVLYYLPSLIQLIGAASTATSLEKLHDLIGIDFYALVYFAPVVYAAYRLGVKGALVAAMVSMLALLPYAIFVDAYPSALFKPTAFAIILSAVGAVVAMLQRSDEQRRASMRELKCLYDIGKAAEESGSLDDFLTTAARLSREAMPDPGATRVTIQVRDKSFESASRSRATSKISQDLVVGSETLGRIEICSRPASSPDQQAHFARALAERIGGAVRGIELEQSLQRYYEELEEEVEKRTHDLEQAQVQLRLLSNTVKNSIDGITLAGLDGVITFANEASQRMWGYGLEEFERMRLNQMFTPGDLELIDNKVLPTARDNVWNGEVTARRRDGSTFPVLLTTSPLRDEKGETIAIVGVHRDITETRNMKDKLIRSERLAAVGELASGVGHELRNPLNVIRNCVYLLHMALAEKGDEDLVSTLKLLDKQVDISNRIVTDLLDFTRIRPPALAQVDLNLLVRESLSWVEVPANVTVITSLDGTSPRVLADSEQVGRAFANIISNAVQAIAGNGEVKISTGVQNGYTWAKFEDNGCGIPPENLAKIFEPLFTTKPKGIGLGLAITKRLVEQNSGVVEVASQVDRGTSFTVKLPTQKRRC